MRKENAENPAYQAPEEDPARHLPFPARKDRKESGARKEKEENGVSRENKERKDRPAHSKSNNSEDQSRMEHSAISPLTARAMNSESSSNSKPVDYPKLSRSGFKDKQPS